MVKWGFLDEIGTQTKTLSSSTFSQAQSLSLTHLPNYSSLLLTDQHYTFIEPKPRTILFRLTPSHPPTVPYNSSTNNYPLEHNYHWVYM
ncbi:hypothetical protein H5410_056748 [Solanum commersonii]|uniref:Uncharacterized protein n=1 Tax=Solanum commersonii TaxID=4109 RepID=A0A9J5WNZ2_SOLCO|nr:hypothetical protein H5410_056748 [Solanum commersonii]